jgi:hypothetical protein
VAIGKPIYLFCPRGHVEQEYNLAFYLRFFKGVAAPRTRRYRRYVRGKYLRAAKRNVVPEGWPGQLLSLAEWEENIANGTYDLTEQGAALSGWLGQIDPLIKERLLPLLRSKEPFVEVEAMAKEGEELLRDDDPVEAKVTDEERHMEKAKEAAEDEDEEDVEDEDDVEEEPEDIQKDIDDGPAML